MRCVPWDVGIPRKPSGSATVAGLLRIARQLNRYPAVSRLLPESRCRSYPIRVTLRAVMRPFNEYDLPPGELDKIERNSALFGRIVLFTLIGFGIGLVIAFLR